MEETKMLTEEQGKYLLKVARKTIENALLGHKEKESEDKNVPAVLHKRRGTFVTLTEHGNLRGCIGHIIPHESIIDGVRINAINAAFRDPRFRPLSPEELDKIKIEESRRETGGGRSHDEAGHLSAAFARGVRLHTAQGGAARDGAGGGDRQLPAQPLREGAGSLPGHTPGRRPG